MRNDGYRQVRRLEGFSLTRGSSHSLGAIANYWFAWPVLVPSCPACSPWVAPFFFACF